MTNEENPSNGEDISRKDLFKFAGIPTAIVAGLIALAFCLRGPSHSEDCVPVEMAQDSLPEDTTFHLDKVGRRLYDVLGEGAFEGFDRCGFRPSY